MSYLKIHYNKQVIELTPEVIKRSLAEIKEQLHKLTLAELLETVNALGIDLAKFVNILKAK